MRSPDSSSPADTRAGSPFSDPAKETNAFRDYRADARLSVREFYRLHHRNQTHEFAQARRKEYLTLDRRRMGIWEAMEFLDSLVDNSDPDTELSQFSHLLQTAEQIRADGHPRWFVLTGLIHDLGKILCLFGEPQWAVVGDTFPVGCAYSDKIVFHEYLRDNPDSQHPDYQTRLGVYGEHCGLDRVHMSWGHDEYLYHVVRDHLPEDALYVIRYHSFYPWHAEGEYSWLTDTRDRAMLHWLEKFRRYDLYTKSHAQPDAAALRPFYEELIREYLPETLRW